MKRSMTHDHDEFQEIGSTMIRSYRGEDVVIVKRGPDLFNASIGNSSANGKDRETALSHLREVLKRSRDAGLFTGTIIFDEKESSD